MPIMTLCTFHQVLKAKTELELLNTLMVLVVHKIIVFIASLSQRSTNNDYVSVKVTLKM